MDVRLKGQFRNEGMVSLPLRSPRRDRYQALSLQPGATAFELQIPDANRILNPPSFSLPGSRCAAMNSSKDLGRL